MTGLPAVLVECAFSSLPYDPAPVWTNITQYVDLPAKIQIEHGRQDEFGDITPDQVTLTLKNDDGRFTPSLASSPYFPNVKTGRQFRITTSIGGVSRFRFTGVVAAWPVSWSGSTATTVRAQMRAVGKLTRLSRIPLRPAGQEEVTVRKASGLVGYWVLDEPAGSSSGADSSGAGQYPMTRRQIGGGDGSVAFGDGTGPGPDRQPAPVFTPASPGNGYSLFAKLKTGVGAGGSTATCTFNPPAGANINGAPVICLEDRAGSWVGVVLDPLNAAYRLLLYAAGSRDIYIGVGTFGPPRGVNQTLTIVVDWQSVGVTGRATLYYGPTLVTSLTFPASVLPKWSAVQVGGAKGREAGTCAGTISNVAVWSRALSAAEVADVNFAINNSGDGFQVWVWWVRLLEYRRESSYGLQGLAYNDLIGPQPTAGRSVPDALQQTARTVGGLSYASVDGRMILQLRDYRANQPVKLTVSGSAGHVDANIVIPGDDALMTNDATAASESGVAYRYTDSASVDEYGPYAATVSGLFRRDTDAEAAAQGRVSGYAEPRVRVPNLTFNLLCSPQSLVQAVMALEIGDRVQVTSMPAQSPVATLDLFAEGWTEVLSDQEWYLTLNTSPADQSDYWIVGDPVWGEVGVTNRVGW